MNFSRIYRIAFLLILFTSSASTFFFGLFNCKKPLQGESESHFKMRQERLMMTRRQMMTRREMPRFYGTVSYGGYGGGLEPGHRRGKRKGKSLFAGLRWG